MLQKGLSFISSTKGERGGESEREIPPSGLREGEAETQETPMLTAVLSTADKR